MAADDILSELGSIVGIGVGSMELMLVKNVLKAGETLHGRLQLKLARPTEAKRLVVGLRATRDRMSTFRDVHGQRRQQLDTDVVFDFEQQLDGARKNYQNDAYDIHLPIPPDAVAQPMKPPEGTLGDILRVASAVSSMLDVGPRPIVWRVHAYLDIPWKVNIKQSVQVSVQPR